MDFSVPTDHRVKIKVNKKRDKYLDLARKLKKKKKILKLKVKVISIRIGALGTIPKEEVRGVAGRFKNQTMN